MRRKIIKQGPSSLMVCLPKEWTKKYNIKKGSEVDVEESGKSLVINLLCEKVPEEQTVDIPSANLFLKRLVQIPYKIGADVMHINTKDREVRDIINKEIEILMGFETIKQTSDYIVLKNVAEGIGKEFENIYRKQFFIIISMFKDLVDYLNAKKGTELKGELKRIVEQDKYLTRANLFSKRILNKAGYAHDKETRAMYAICTLLELASDSVRRICEKLMEDDVSLKKETIEGISLALKHMELFEEYRKKRDISLLFKLRKKKNELFVHIYDEISKGDKNNWIYIHLLKITDEIHHITEELL